MQKMTKQEGRNAEIWIETSDAVHYNLKKAWKDFKDVDPVDAVKDAELLFRVLEARLITEAQEVKDTGRF